MRYTTYPPLRLALDTATMVAAIRSDSGASRRLLRAALEGRGLTLLVSVPLLIEYEAVMTRPEHLMAARLTTDDIGVLLDAVAAVAERVGLAFLWRPVLPDADDDMILETAMNGRADGIVHLHEAQVFDDLSGPTVEILAIVTKSEVEAWLRHFGDPV